MSVREQEKMAQSTKDRLEGSIHEAKGKIKEKAGQISNNPALADEGTDEKVAGKIQRKIGEIEKVLEK
jgi:uncharacterized protein YjbJ (UPF0337 family)